jgi:hypothetical protein
MTSEAGVNTIRKMSWFFNFTYGNIETEKNMQMNPPKRRFKQTPYQGRISTSVTEWWVSHYLYYLYLKPHMKNKGNT